MRSKRFRLANWQSWTSFIRERENAAWDRQIDADFAEDGRLRPILEEVRDDIRAGRLEDLP